MMKKNLKGELISEFIGAFILLFFGSGSVATLVLKGADYNLWDISLLWGLGVTMAIYVTGAVSGTHINPAVTIALAVFKGFPWKKVVPYTIAQVAGTFTGAAMVFGLYSRSFAEFEASAGIIRGSIDSMTTAGVFSTYPHSYLSNIHALIVEIVITAILVLVIFALGDEKNINAPKGKYAPFAAILIGITIAIIGGTFGSLTGFAMNPARDFGPKLFTSLAGWGRIGLPAPNNYFWVPILGPIIGALIGGYLYQHAVSKYILVQKEIEKVKEVQEKAA
ncbi:MIP/aquaporin family protein [Clostridium formicaceticum]|uniref:Aquaporin n=1 Tax=Clostridium formicaceticum TaxID=1497 RepID=A0AAC9RIT9_9CLOT|nr:MIP/aquaporin family protein [Clostridium formicaceticum]AOY75985.1 aquaporin [Clostridium formicaceticum]ARE86334.1 Glycerol uptake facilitator protein [Clostridium formicaceticum]